MLVQFDHVIVDRTVVLLQKLSSGTIRNPPILTRGCDLYFILPVTGTDLKSERHCDTVIAPPSKCWLVDSGRGQSVHQLKRTLMYGVYVRLN